MSPIDTPQNDSFNQPDSVARPGGRAEDVATGVVIICIGLAFLAGNLGIHLPFLHWDNWWALFILIGAVAPATRAIARYRSVGTIDARVAHWVLSSLGTVVVALMFLLDVSLETWWPVFVVLGGLCMLVPGSRRRDRDGRRIRSR
jgi:hypothetical protein